MYNFKIFPIIKNIVQNIKNICNYLKQLDFPLPMTFFYYFIVLVLVSVKISASQNYCVVKF